MNWIFILMIEYLIGFACMIFWIYSGKLSITPATRFYKFLAIVIWPLIWVSMLFILLKDLYKTKKNAF